jgi:hypothetical protein
MLLNIYVDEKEKKQKVNFLTVLIYIFFLINKKKVPFSIFKNDFVDFRCLRNKIIYLK